MYIWGNFQSTCCRQVIICVFKWYWVNCYIFDFFNKKYVIRDFCRQIIILRGCGWGSNAGKQTWFWSPTTATIPRVWLADSIRPKGANKISRRCVMFCNIWKSNIYFFPPAKFLSKVSNEKCCTYLFSENLLIQKKSVLLKSFVK